MSLINYSIILFAIAAMMGAYLLGRILRNLNTPKGISIIHGGVAAMALALLTVYAIKFNRHDLFVFIALFVAAAMGGLVLIFRDLRGQTIPKILALLHGILAVSALVTLLINYW